MSKLVFNVNKIQDKEESIEDLIKKYYDSEPWRQSYAGRGDDELEVKFGTGAARRIQLKRSDYDSVIRKLVSLGFSQGEMMEDYSLRIFFPSKDRPSFLRAEVKTFESIQRYCETNSLDAARTEFIEKKKVHSSRGVDNRDFNFKITWNRETPASGFRDISSTSGELGKTFRFINRVTFTHENYPVKVDISIVKSSKNFDRYLPTGQKDDKGNDIYHLEQETFKDVASSGVFTAVEKYEIEIEVDNKKIGPETEFPQPGDLVTSLKKVIKFVLCGIQKTNYPIKIEEQTDVKKDYGSLFARKTVTINKRAMPERYFFVGPNPVTLQLENVSEKTREKVPNIRNNYVVTDKADGERSLLFVSGKGKIYLISSNMDVRFTGAVTTDETLYRSLLDGELVSHDIYKDPINLYLGFDLYCLNGKDTRKLPLVSVKKDGQSRYRLLQRVTETLGRTMTSIIKATIVSPITVQHKRFLPEVPTDNGNDIFDACKSFLTEKNSQLYETDGLIFTPAFLCVYGMEGVRCDEVPNKSLSWYGAFKWKPPEFNTIDFLVSTVKNKGGTDEIVKAYSSGMNTERIEQDESFKIIELKVSCKKGEFNPNLRPCDAILKDEYTVEKDKGDTFDTYPLTFVPIDPVDPNEGRCMIKLDINGQMTCEEGEVFRDKMIVEFSYNKEERRWKPLRVRHDKTNAMLSRTVGVKYGNTYEVALSNWISIHYDVKEEMLKTGVIPVNDDDKEEKEVYYSNAGKDKGQRGLREYHNYYKSKLVGAVSRKKSNERTKLLIDYACGLGGDITKWDKANIKFVLGIDLYENNINRTGGACSRYVNLRIDEESKGKKDIMQAIFLQGNSSLNIKNGAAFGDNLTSFQVVKALFNDGIREQEAKVLGKGVSKSFGIARDGFDISSCQFALHYFFKDVRTLRGFITNLSECTKLNGYFIGTAYDGKKIYELLRRNNGLMQFKDEVAGNVTLSIQRGRYTDDDNSFLDSNDASTLGKDISVLQESIGQAITEYLINFDYFNSVMQNFGFAPIDAKEANIFGLPYDKGIGTFEDLFKQYNKDKSTDRLEDYAANLTDMTPTEKRISFLSMYFVYQKIRDVDPNSVIMEEEIMMPVVGEGEGEQEDEEFEVDILNPKIKKLKGSEQTLLTEGMEDVQLNLKKRAQLETEAPQEQEETGKPPEKKKNKTAKNKTDVPPAETKKVYTITFGDVAENHAAMQKIGTLHEKGYSVAQLRDIQQRLTELGLTTEMADLNVGFETFPDAKVLVIRKGAQFILGEESTAGLMAENDKLSMDKKALMKGRVVNKVARWNLCFADEDQEPSYGDGKGRIVAWKHVPKVSAIRDRIAQWTSDVPLNGEANYYYDISQCGIGFHGDAERRKVFAVRMGETMPLYFKWFQNSLPVSEPIELVLNDGDMYIMSEKAVGNDWLRKKIPTLRHSTGCAKFTGVNK
jgi:hypothetical protein